MRGGARLLGDGGRAVGDAGGGKPGEAPGRVEAMSDLGSEELEEEGENDLGVSTSDAGGFPGCAGSPDSRRGKP